MLASSCSSSNSLARLYSRTLTRTCQPRLLHVPATDSSSSSPRVPPLQTGDEGKQPPKLQAANPKKPWIVDRTRPARPYGGRGKDEAGFRRERMSAITEQLSRQKSLTPAVIAYRAKLICGAEGAQAAYEWAKTVPINLQTPVLWNTVMKQAVAEGRFQFAFKIFNDMKRSGINPTVITFGTLFSGLACTESPEDHPKQVQMAHSLLDQYKRFAQNFKSGEKSAGISPQAPPLNHAIRFFAKIDDFDTVFEIYNSMEDEYATAPNKHTFCTLFYALMLRKTTSKTNGLTIAQQNASDAKLLWRDIERAQTKHGIPISGWFLAPLLMLLSRGRDTDRKFAVELIQEYVSTEVPGTEKKGTGKKLVTVRKELLEAILELYNADATPEKAVELVEALKDHVTSRGKSGSPSIARFDEKLRSIGVQNVHRCMLSYASLVDATRLEEKRVPDTSDKAESAVDEAHLEDGRSKSPPLTNSSATAHYASRALELCRWSLTEAAIVGDPIVIRRSTWDILFQICERESDFNTAREALLLYIQSRTRNRAPEQRDSSKPIKYTLTVNLQALNAFAQTALSTQDQRIYADFMQLIERFHLTDEIVYHVTPKPWNFPQPKRWPSSEYDMPVNRLGEFLTWQRWLEVSKESHQRLLEAMTVFCQALISKPDELSGGGEERYKSIIEACRKGLSRHAGNSSADATRRK